MGELINEKKSQLRSVDIELSYEPKNIGLISQKTELEIEISRLENTKARILDRIGVEVRGDIYTIKEIRDIIEEEL